MVHAADDRLAFGGKTGHHQRCAGTDVGGAYGCAAEVRHAAYDRVMTIRADVGAEPLELLHLAEAAGIEVLGDDADTIGNGQHRDDQRLVVGGDAGVWQRGNIDRAQALFGVHRQAVTD